MLRSYYYMLTIYNNNYTPYCLCINELVTYSKYLSEYSYGYSNATCVL